MAGKRGNPRRRLAPKSWIALAPPSRCNDMPFGERRLADALLDQFRDCLRLIGIDERLARIHVGRGKPHCLVEVGFHDGNEALHVRLLVNLDLDVAIDHLLDDFRHKVEAAEQHFAGGTPRSSSTRATAACQKPVSKYAFTSLLALR